MLLFLGVFSVFNGDSFTFSHPTIASGFTDDGQHGIGLGGMTLAVIPEPATIGLIGIGAIMAMVTARFKRKK